MECDPLILCIINLREFLVNGVLLKVPQFGMKVGFDTASLALQKVAFFA